jgi:hypothetical protein
MGGNPNSAQVSRSVEGRAQSAGVSAIDTMDDVIAGAQRIPQSCCAQIRGRVVDRAHTDKLLLRVSLQEMKVSCSHRKWSVSEQIESA